MWRKFEAISCGILNLFFFFVMCMCIFYTYGCDLRSSKLRTSLEDLHVSC